MRDAQTYGERALLIFEAVVDGSHAELLAQIDALNDDDLYAVQQAAEHLSVLARAEWMRRTRKPAGRPS